MTKLRVKSARIAFACSSAMALATIATAAQAQGVPSASPSEATVDQAAPSNQPVSPQSANEAETIVVTGSRIQRRDFEANSPIVTANEELLDQSSTAAIETNLNKLPAFTPVQTPALGGDIQATATNTPGAATISLRNLGTNRNLVLIDGRRATPANALGPVDINTIPQAAIERVEIITGGASATYGADAVAGVVNFILKKNLQGLQLDGRMAVSQRGDAFEYQVSGLMGTNFEDGRGNVTVGFAVNDRSSAKRTGRPWFRKQMRDPRFAGNEFFPDFSGYDPGTNPPSQAAYNALFGAGRVTAGNGRLYFNNDGTAFTGFFQSDLDGAFRFNADTTGLKWARTADGGLKQNFQDELLVLPLNRYNIYANGNYEINDWVSAFARGDFTRASTHTIGQPSPSVNGWSAFVPASNPVPTELRAVLNSRANPNAPWQLVYYLNQKNREVFSDTNTFNIVAGFNGKIPGSDWTWEIYGSKGESSTSSLTTGTASLERFRAIVGSTTNGPYGAGFRAQGNPLFGGFGASTATCTSGFDPFNKGNTSADCLEAISADLQTRSIMKQSVWEGNVQGGLFELPAGEIRVALGATHRENNYRYINDTLTTQGRSFLDQTIGIYPSGNSRGIIKVDEAYGELLVPVLSDLPLIKKFELELGARQSKYNTTGNAFTWKALGDWEVTDWLRIRGGFNKAVRAPNVAELYLAPQQTFTAAGGGDVCRTNNSLPYSANTATNPNAANVLAVCQILMNQATPGTSARFYGDPNFFAPGSPIAFAFPTLTGNPNLSPEKAKTWTAGVVINSPFESEALRRLRVSIDYYNIKVTDAIGPSTLDSAQLQCFSQAYNPLITGSPAAAAATEACQRIGRVAGDGALGNVLVTYQNSGRFRTSGIDVNLDWRVDVGPGTLSLNSVFNYLIELKSSALPTAPLVDYAGTLGPAGSNGIGENGLNPGAFEWKMLNTLGYSIGPATLSLQWQHLPSAKSINFTSNPNTPNIGAPKYDVFNLSGSFAVTENASFSFGVDNLFDKAPPYTEYNPTTTGLANALGGNPINPYFYDLNGRRFYLGGKFKF
jgi:outer membrane receptor protein involved in Fe transport